MNFEQCIVDKDFEQNKPIFIKGFLGAIFCLFAYFLMSLGVNLIIYSNLELMFHLKSVFLSYLAISSVYCYKECNEVLNNVNINQTEFVALVGFVFGQLALAVILIIILMAFD